MMIKISKIRHCSTLLRLTAKLLSTSKSCLILSFPSGGQISIHHSKSAYPKRGWGNFKINNIRSSKINDSFYYIYHAPPVLYITLY
jgi:hypothetical protein